MTCVYVRAMHAIVEIHMENMAVSRRFYNDDDDDAAAILVVVVAAALEMCALRNINDSVEQLCICPIFFILWLLIVSLFALLLSGRPFVRPLLSTPDTHFASFSFCMRSDFLLAHN